MALPKWTEERTASLAEFVGDESPVSQDTVAEAADEMETSPRAISSKLRKMGYEVELASSRARRAYTDEQEAALQEFVTGNSGEYTYAQIAKVFEDGAFTPKSIQGKILSMELTDHVKPAPKPESKKTFTDEEEAKFISMAESGAFLEDIAEALDRPQNQVRGKALSLLRGEKIVSIPKQKHTKNTDRIDPLAELEDLAEMTVDAIADVIGKTARGVKVMLTRRGLSCVDHDGAAKRAKADSAS